MNTPNVDLAIDIFAHIELHPEAHKQESWSSAEVERPPGIAADSVWGLDPAVVMRGCNTSHCFAGWACVLTGHELDWRIEEITPATVYLGAEYVTGPAHGSRTLIRTAANDVLGINEAAYGDFDTVGLYEATNTKDDLYRKAAHVFNIEESVLREKVTVRVNELNGLTEGPSM